MQVISVAYVLRLGCSLLNIRGRGLIPASPNLWAEFSVSSVVSRMLNQLEGVPERMLGLASKSSAISRSSAGSGWPGSSMVFELPSFWFERLTGFGPTSAKADYMLHSRTKLYNKFPTLCGTWRGYLITN